jgi:hypothetical protein
MCSYVGGLPDSEADFAPSALLAAVDRPFLSIGLPRSSFVVTLLKFCSLSRFILTLSAHLAEHGVIAPQGVANLALLAKIMEDHEASLELIVVETGRLYLDQIDALVRRRMIWDFWGSGRMEFPARFAG